MKKEELCRNALTHCCIQSHQMQIYKMLYNAIVTYVDLPLKIHSTFINETVKVLSYFISLWA